MKDPLSTRKPIPRFLGTPLLAAVLCAPLAPSLALAQTPAATKSASPQARVAPTTATPPPQESAPKAAETAPIAAETAPLTEEQQASVQAALTAADGAYKSGDYVTAEEQFRKAVDVGHGINAQFGLAMSLDLQGKIAQALTAFVDTQTHPAFSTLDPSEQDATNRRVDVLRQVPGKLQLTVSPASATITIDGQPETAGEVLTLSAGKHKLAVNAEGFVGQTLEIEVAPAGSLEQTVSLEAAPKPKAAAAPPAEEAAPPPPPPPPSKVPAYVTLGVAGAGAIVGTIFGLQALSAKDDFDADPTTANADDVERNALISDMSFGVALTLGITGIVLLTTDEPETTATRQVPRKTVRLSPYVSPTGAGASARLIF